MTFRFNILLKNAGIDPAAVRLLRHQTDLPNKRTLYEVMQSDPALFQRYQSLQLTANRARFARPYWAAFFGTWDGRTVFGGLFEVAKPDLLTEEVEFPIQGGKLTSSTYDFYPTVLSPLLDHYRGRLYIDWGGGASGKRAWSQRAEAQDKFITELHLDAAERPFPGFLELAASLSFLADAPPSWHQKLASAKGVYLLTCPQSGELYVGSATAAGGFWSRWQEYRRNGQGGNAALVDRQPTDWIASILQVAGSANTTDDILTMEAIWKQKLETRRLGLNRN
jgi:hypothetical protein